MTVYVDPLREMKTSDGVFRRGACHMMADTPEELEAMRVAMSLRKNWLHEDHYDLSRQKRKLAVDNGAKEITVREMVEVRQRNKKIEEEKNR